MNKKQLIITGLIFILIFVCLNVGLALPNLEVTNIFYGEKEQSCAIVNGQKVKVGDKINEAEVIEINKNYIKFKYGEEVFFKIFISPEVKKKIEQEKKIEDFADFCTQNNIKSYSRGGKSYFLTDEQAKDLGRKEACLVTDYLYTDYSEATLRRALYCFKYRTSLSTKRLGLILDGKIVMGINKEEVIASWGQPADINRTVTATFVHEQWVYGDKKYLYFEDDVLTSWQD